MHRAKTQSKGPGDWRPGIIGAALTVTVGLLAWLLPFGHGLVHWSYDLPALFGPKESPPEVLLVKLDEMSFTELRQPYPYFDRTNHANLLRNLSAGQARLVVFDVYFPQSDPRPTDAELAEAIRANGRVVLAADYSALPGLTASVAAINPPLAAFRQGARAWGLSLVELDAEPAVRKHYAGTEEIPSLPWAAAAALAAPITKSANARLTEKWLRYYGPDGTLPSLSYYLALKQPPEIFKDKIVFVGGKPKTRFVREETDEFHTPFTHRGGPFMAGVEINATTFLNLLRGDWLTRPAAWIELSLILGLGVLAGLGLVTRRPVAATVWALAGIGLTGLAAGWLFWQHNLWFSWLIVAGLQIPCAWAWAIMRRALMVTGPAATLPAAAPQRSPIQTVQSVQPRPGPPPAKPASNGLPVWFPEI